MRRQRLTSILRRIHGSARTDMGNGKALEADLLTRYRKLHPQNRRWLVLLNPWNRTARFGFAGLAACLLVVVACTTETITEVEVGKQVIMNMETDVNEDVNVYVNVDLRSIHTFIHIAQEDPSQPQNEISALLTAQPGVEDVSVSVSVEEEGERYINVDILVFGSDLDGEGLVSALTDSYPALSHAAVTINNLHTTFSESLASKIGRTLFRVEGSRPAPHELRLQVLEELATRG
jgi:hypothetical protein